MDYLKDLLSSYTPTLKTLPILHSCEAAFLLEILKTSELRTSHCDVFNDSHLYAFYGVPSYRVNKSASFGNPGYFPVCFIFDYEKIPDLDRLYPFDTGAFVKLEDIKKNHFHSSTKLEDLELNPSIDDAKKLIDFFYSKNENYIVHKPIKGVDQIESIKYNVWGYASLINDKSASAYDNRVATIELIYKQPITITKDNLIQIILPAAFLDNPEISDLITNVFNISKPITYETIKGDAREYFGIIYNNYLHFIRLNNLV